VKWILLLIMLFYCMGQVVKKDWHVQNFPPQVFTVKTEHACSEQVDKLGFYNSDWKEIRCTESVFALTSSFSKCFISKLGTRYDLQLVFFSLRKKGCQSL
ncbi:MAG: hypothetical protein AAFO91_14010, partial [Bacteroidota bacterium]